MKTGDRTVDKLLRMHAGDSESLLILARRFEAIATKLRAYSHAEPGEPFKLPRLKSRWKWEWNS